MKMSPNRGPSEAQQEMAICFCSEFSANLLAGVLCEVASMKIKLFRLSSHLQESAVRDSYSSGVNP
jgi:hypothetical protein